MEVSLASVLCAHCVIRINTIKLNVETLCVDSKDEFIRGFYLFYSFLIKLNSTQRKYNTIYGE